MGAPKQLVRYGAGRTVQEQCMTLLGRAVFVAMLTRRR
jgi:hypothetical protein